MQKLYQANCENLVYDKKNLPEINHDIQKFRDIAIKNGIVLDFCNIDLFEKVIKPFYMAIVMKNA